MQFPFDQSLLMPPKQVAALQGGMDMYSKLLQAIALPEMLKNQRQMNQANLQARQLQNQYYPQLTQADIDYKKAQVPYLGAQTAQTEEETKLSPFKAMIEAQNSQTAMQNANRLQQNRGAAYAMTRMLQQLPSGAKDVWIASDQNEYNWLLNYYANEAKNEMVQKNSNQNQKGLLTPEIFKQAGLPVRPSLQDQNQPQSSTQQQSNPQINTQNGQSIPLKSPAIVGQNLPGAPTGQLTLTDKDYQDIGKNSIFNTEITDDNGNVIPPVSNNQSEQPPVEGIDQKTGLPQITLGNPTAIQNLSPGMKQQWQTMEAANNAAITPTQRNRKIMAISLMNVTREPEIQKAMLELSDPKYSGMVGKSEAYLKERFKPAEIAEYNSIKERLHTLLSGSLKGVEAIPTSNMGMERSADFFKTIANDKAWKRDSQAQLIDTLTAMRLADAESGAIIKSSQPVYATYSLPEGGPPILEQALKEKQGNINRTNNLLVQSGLKKGSNSEIKVPSFNSKSEFQTWYSQQSPEVKEQLRRQGGQ